MTYCKHYPPTHTPQQRLGPLVVVRVQTEGSCSPFVLLMNEPLVLSSGLGFLKILNTVLNFGRKVPKLPSLLAQKPHGFPSALHVLAMSCLPCLLLPSWGLWCPGQPGSLQPFSGIKDKLDDAVSLYLQPSCFPASPSQNGNPQEHQSNLLEIRVF